MKYTTYSHCDGETRLNAACKVEIGEAITGVTIKPTRGAARKIRNQVILLLKEAGWSDELAVAKGSAMTITSTKGNVGLCFQTGNMARLYADLLKLQTLYLSNAITSAAFVVPSKPLAKLLGDNIAQSTRLERELEIFKRAFHVPTLIFALEI